MMINAATMHYFNQAYDKDAFYARQGQLIPELLKAMNIPTFKKSPLNQPDAKSLVKIMSIIF